LLHQLANAGNTLIVIEHNLKVIITADWLIDLGPEEGRRPWVMGGKLAYRTPLIKMASE
jgi:excinuclease UvrABC ATPase subunit